MVLEFQYVTRVLYFDSTALRLAVDYLDFLCVAAFELDSARPFACGVHHWFPIVRSHWCRSCAAVEWVLYNGSNMVHN